MTEWQARTIEQRNLLNPAFCAVVLWIVANVGGCVPAYKSGCETAF